MTSSRSTKSSSGTKKRAQPLNKKAPAKKPSKKTAARKTVQSAESGNGEVILTLDPVLVVNNAIDMHKKFSSYLENNDTEMVVDASLVEMIDTPMIQLLFALVRELKSKNVAIVWRSPSSEFLNRVCSLGLTDMFGIDSRV